MLFKKLFRLLVLGGAMVGTSAGCAGPGQAQTGEKKPESRNGGASPDGGTATAQDPDAGAAADAGGGGVVGW